MTPSLDLRENREFASELKFILLPVQAATVRDWAREHLSADPNAGGGGSEDGYRITSLYFDTEGFGVFHKQGSFRRCKYRVRRYGDADAAFVERKLKTGGRVSKRRSLVAIDELDRLAVPDAQQNTWGGSWFHRRISARDLRVQCQISYQRTARVGMTGAGPIRLTIDDQIRALPAGEPAFQLESGGLPLMADELILELKFRSAMPVLFKRLIEDHGLIARGASKYRMAAEALGLVSQPANGATAALREVALHA